MFEIVSNNLEGTQGDTMNRIMYARIAAFALLLFIISVVWLVIPSYLFIVKKCTFSFDNYLAPRIKQEISTCIQEQFVNKPFRSLSLITIKNQFPHLENIVAGYTCQGIVHCIMRTQKPLLRINENFVLMENGHVYDTAYFDQKVLHTLHMMHTADQNLKEFSATHVDAIKKIHRYLFEHFNLTWIDHTCIELQDKKIPNFFVRTDIQTTLTEKLFQCYEKIKKQIMSQRLFAKKQWRFDVRFKNQIIVAQKGVGEL